MACGVKNRRRRPCTRVRFLSRESADPVDPVRHSFNGVYSLSAVEQPYYVAEGVTSPPIIPVSTLLDPIKLHRFLATLRERRIFLLPLLDEGRGLLLLHEGTPSAQPALDGGASMRVGDAALSVVSSMALLMGDMEGASPRSLQDIVPRYRPCTRYPVHVSEHIIEEHMLIDNQYILSTGMHPGTTSKFYPIHIEIRF